MKGRKEIVILSLLVLLMAWVPSPARSGAGDCLIQVDEPRSGQEVGKGVTVEGTATLPPDYHLWVFARRASYRDFQVWWPQGEGLLDPETGKWKVSAAIGKPQDIGSDFDIAVAIFGREHHLQVRKHYKKVLTSESPPAREMPTPACSPVVLVVKKTRHD